MANELDELKAQLQAERSKNEKLSARLVTAEQTVLTHGPTTTPAIYGEFLTSTRGGCEFRSQL